MELKDMLQFPVLEECKKVLCVQPHPDDNEVGAGATIAKLTSLGCEVTYVTVTDGRTGTLDPNQPPEEIVEIRKKEVERAAAFLGVRDVIFLGFPDGGYADEKELCKAVVSAVRKVKPDLIMAPDPFLPYECHPDHRRAGMAAAESCIFSPFPGFKTDDGLPGWAAKGIAFYSSANPNTFIDVDKTWERKMQSIALHESQFDPASLQKLGMYFEYKARSYAQGKGFERAEAFKVLPTDCLHVFVDAIHI